MKVLLVYVITENVNMPVVPMGMACVAASAQKAGHEVRQFSLRPNNIKSVLSTVINDFQPDVIGISARNVDDQSMENPRFLLEPIKEAVSCCKKISKAPVVLGGAGYSMFPKSALEYLGADMGIQGEGEEAFVALLDNMRKDSDISIIPGLYLPESGLQKDARLIDKLDDVSLPPPDAYPDLSTFSDDEEIYLPIQTRRGCPMACSYCTTPNIDGWILRKFPIKRVIDFISDYATAGFDQFIFVDNIFNFPPAYAKELCSSIVSSGLKIKWRGILYPWKTDSDLVKLMAKAGCVEVALGFESSSEKILSIMNKKYKTDDVIRISKLLKEHGIRQMGFLLLGGPGETRETAEQSLNFADSLDLDLVRATPGIRIYPNTPLAETAVNEKTIDPDDNLLLPKFYLVKELKGWLPEIVKKWVEERPHWIM